MGGRRRQTPRAWAPKPTGRRARFAISGSPIGIGSSECCDTGRPKRTAAKRRFKSIWRLARNLKKKRKKKRPSGRQTPHTSGNLRRPRRRNWKCSMTSSRNTWVTALTVIAAGLAYRWSHRPSPGARLASNFSRAAGYPWMPLSLPGDAPLKFEPPIPVEPKPVTAPPPPKKGAETFDEAAAIYLKNELRDGVKPATVQEYRRKIDAFEHKDKPLRTITRGMAAEFLDGLPDQKRTRNLYDTLFSATYKSAIRRDKATVNPFEGQSLKVVARVHYEPFTDEELATLFADAKLEIKPQKHTTATALPWCGIIAAFTGCRRDEIASLMASDIKQTNGIWFFDIRDGKTENAERVVPVHHALIDAGLLRYRDALSHGSRLFPSLKGPPSAPDKIGKALGYAFEAWRKRLGIVRERVNFHSFRHTVGDRLRKAGVAKDDRGFLLGHADVEMQNKVYGHDGPGLHRLKAIVEKLSYPGLSPKTSAALETRAGASTKSGTPARRRGRP